MATLHLVPEPTKNARAHADAIREIHAAHERAVPQHRRALEVFTTHLAQPRSVLAVVGVSALWIGANLAGPRLGLPAWDPPPFALLEFLLTLVAVSITLLILIKQDRQGYVDQERMRLVLLLSLLTDERSARALQLLEDVRRKLELPANDARNDERLRHRLDVRRALEELEASFEADSEESSEGP